MRDILDMNTTDVSCQLGHIPYEDSPVFATPAVQSVDGSWFHIHTFSFSGQCFSGVQQH